MQVLSIQLGKVQPQRIGGKRVPTAIVKTPMSGAVAVQPLGLVGDEQADPTVHGGLRKAVYAYPSEHYAYWRAQRLGLGGAADLPWGSLGENLTLSGLLEPDVFVGDTLHFPDCVLRVTQPREPCFKFNAVMGDKLAAKKMAHSGFCGFYLSVESPGTLAPGATFTLQPGPRQTAIAELFRVSMRKTRDDG